MMTRQKVNCVVSTLKDEQHVSRYHWGDGRDNRPEQTGVEGSFELLNPGSWEIRIATRVARRGD